MFLSSFDHISDSLYAEGIMHEDDIGDGKKLSNLAKCDTILASLVVQK